MVPAGRELASSLLTRVSARVVASLLQFTTFLLLARSLGPEDFGRLALLISIAAVASSVLAFGLPTSSLRVLATAEPRATGLTTVLVLLASFAAVSAFVVSLGWLLPIPTPIVAAAAISVFGEGANDAVQWVLTGLERHRSAALLMVLRRTLVVVAVSAAAISNESLLDAYTVASAIIVCIPLSVLYRLRGRRGSLRALIVDSRRYWPLSMLSALWSLDVTVASLALGNRVAGLYAASARLSGPLGLIVQSMLAIVTPRLVATDASGRAELERAVTRAVWAYAVGVVALSPALVYGAVVFLGPEYREAWPILMAVCIGSAVSIFAQRRIALMVAADEPTIANWSIGVGVAVGLLSMATLGSLFGVIGLAASVILAQLGILISLRTLSESARRRTA